MAGASYYEKLLGAMAKNGRSLMCPFCGAYTISINNQGLCYVCENVISSDRTVLIKTDSYLCSLLDDYNKQVAGQDFDTAIKTYDSIMAKHLTPNYTYVKALTYISYSNHELTKIRYDLPGFMGENSAHKETASRLFSSARLFFNKSIFDAEKTTATSQGSYGVDYIIFLSSIKLGDLAGAKSCLNRLKQSGNKYIAAYAEIVYDSNIGEFDSLLRNADLMLEGADFPINLFYYVAYALFRLGRRSDAESLSEKLGKMMGSNTMASLNAYAKTLG